MINISFLLGMQEQVWRPEVQPGNGLRHYSEERAGGHKGTTTGEVSKKRCSRPSTFPVGERKARKEETDEGPPMRQGGIPGIPGRGRWKPRTSKASGEIPAQRGCALRFKAWGQGVDRRLKRQAVSS